MPDSSDINAPQPLKDAATFRSPGVSVSDTNSRTITGNFPGATAFVGPTLKGPDAKTPRLVMTLAQFQAFYGNLSDLTGTSALSFIALAAKSFFENGGQKLYIARPVTADGTFPTAPTVEDYTRALASLEDIDDIAIVAAPGASIPNVPAIDSAASIHAALIAHVSRPQSFRFAILDPPSGCSIPDVQSLRSRIDSPNAALYYPWVTTSNPLPDSSAYPEINLPPSGFLCGIYTLSETQQGISKAPANLPVIGAVGLERSVTNADSDTLNPLGINCLRSFPGKGILVWGARTTSSDPEWKYVNVRRYLSYLESSIYTGTQWAVFEQNNERLWQIIRGDVSNFLGHEWQQGALSGSKPDQAFFVQCDRSTMTQSDLDNGRMVCLVGVAPIRSAEFIIFRIGQKTADTPAS